MFWAISSFVAMFSESIIMKERIKWIFLFTVRPKKPEDMDEEEEDDDGDKDAFEIIEDSD